MFQVDYFAGGALKLLVTLLYWPIQSLTRWDRPLNLSLDLDFYRLDKPMSDKPHQRDQHGVRAVPAYFIPAGGEAPVKEECLVVEEAMLTIDVQDVGWYTLMWTQTDSAREVVGFTKAEGVLALTDDPEVLALAAGFLFTEGLIHDLGDIASMEVCSSDPSIVRVKLVAPDTVNPNRRNVTIGSSCSVCGGREALENLVAELESIQDTTHLDSEQFAQLMSAMRELQTIFETTGGAHAAAVFNRDAEIIALAEDLGRHNALDKVIGKCLLSGKHLSGCGVLLSSRLSLEMVTKAIRGGFEIIAAVSAPTSLAIEIADRFGVTLCGFVRGGRATIYSHPQRIKEIARVADVS
jgi:FdhD protein